MANTDTPTPTSQALATVDNSPKAMVKRYQDSFAAVLPSHITRPETWIRLAQGALKKGKRVADGRTELEVAADNNHGVFLATLLDCARLGLEPGTDQYYLTPRKVKGRLEILGIIGYQGHIELMYRAGAVSSVIAENVRQSDLFVWTPGLIDGPSVVGWQGHPRWEGPMVRPFHEIDHYAADRGPLVLTYAYAVMKDGATSKVVVLNRSDIDRIKTRSGSAKSDRSPWHTDEASMWLKSGVRQLQKWVPTSAEYRNQQLQSAGQAVVARSEIDPVDDLPAAPSDDGWDDDDIVDAEIVENDNGQWDGDDGKVYDPDGNPVVDSGVRS